VAAAALDAGSNTAKYDITVTRRLSSSCLAIGRGPGPDARGELIRTDAAGSAGACLLVGEVDRQGPPDRVGDLTSQPASQPAGPWSMNAHSWWQP
jgi:hypothetical protein